MSSSAPALDWAEVEARTGRTVWDYCDVLRGQGGRCASCHRHPTFTPHVERFVWDHDRACCPGEDTCGACLRGIVCPGCAETIKILAEPTTAGVLRYLDRWNHAVSGL